MSENLLGHLAVRTEKVNTQINDEVEYKFRTERGIMRISPSEIMKILAEVSERNNSEIVPPEEDLQGWDIINATDEDGKSHPFFLMRTLPFATSFNYKKFKKDDDNIVDLLLRDVYKVTPSRIKWIKFKRWARGLVYRIIRKVKK
jgi:hypothetical protein